MFCSTRLWSKQIEVEEKFHMFSHYGMEVRGQFHGWVALLVPKVGLLHIEDERETALLGIELQLLAF